VIRKPEDLPETWLGAFVDREGLSIKSLRIKKGNPRIDNIDPGIFFGFVSVKEV
jgi:hypothetical protein